MSVGALAETSRPRPTSARVAVREADRTTLIVVALTAVAAALRFWRIWHQSYWYDEAFTVVLTHHSPGQMLGLLPQTELTPPLYYCIAWVWVRIFGYGEAGLRSLSALAGVATIPVIYGAGAKLISRRAGLVAAALAACNPLLIWYSQEARSYSVLILMAGLSLLTFAHVREPGPQPRWLVAWVVAAGLTLATHYYGVLAVVPEAVWLVWVHRRDRRVLLAVGAVAVIGLALLPIAVNQRRHANWISWWPLDQRLSQIGPQFLLGTGTPIRTVLKLAGAVSVVVAAVLLTWRADPAERRGALTAGALALSGFLIALLLLLAGADELITRNIIVILVPLIVLVAAGLGARRAGTFGLLGAATLCTVGVIAAMAVSFNGNFQRPDWRGLASALGTRRPSPTGRAVLLEYYPGLLPLALYSPTLRFVRRPGARVQEIDVVSVQGPNLGWFCWWGSACNMSLSVLDTPMRIPGFRAAGPVTQVGRWSILRLRAPVPTRITPREVSTALTTTLLPFDGLLFQPARAPA